MKWLVLACLVLAPLASAGDASDPEVDDATGDHFTGVSQDPAMAWDIDYAFFSDTGCGDGEDLVELGVANMVTGNAGNPGAIITQTVFFTIDNAPHRLVGRSQTGDGADPSFTLYHPGGTDSVSGAYQNSGPEAVQFCLPHELVGGAGTIVTAIWAQTMLEEVDGADRHELDRAPDDAPATTGRPWVIGGIPDAFPLLNVTVGDAEQNLVGGKTTFLINVQNNGTGDDTVTFNVTANATADWSVVIDPPSVDVAAGTGAFVNVNVTYAGNLTAYAPASFNVTWQGSTMTGSLLLKVPGVSASTTATGTPSPTGNETSDGGADKDTPLPLWIAMAVLVVAALRRQRT